MGRKVIFLLAILVLLIQLVFLVEPYIRRGRKAKEDRVSAVAAVTPTPPSRRYFLPRSERVTISIPKDLDSPLAGQSFAFTGEEIYAQTLAGNTIVSIGVKEYFIPVFKVVAVEERGVWFEFLVAEVEFRFLQQWQTAALSSSSNLRRLFIC